MKHALSRQRWLTATVAGIALLTASAWASATPMHFRANFTPLNNSGVSGMARLTLNMDTLTVSIHATGLVPDHAHAQHIHGTFDASGNPTNATTPTLAVDTNHDGLIEVTEGAATYGPILLPLTPFPTAPGGTINYTQTFDLTNSGIYFVPPGSAVSPYSEPDLMPLFFRELVIHGAFTPIAIDNGGLSGDVHFDAGAYVGTLPVASAEIFAVVPEPSVFGMMLGGLGLLLGFVWLRRADNRKKALS